ncbi:hypothetical protein Bbelb_284010 [Branchiostoma belcheri]|nr:hypothetical protein Bbelb_284010 [Branchiostoma belcheri]
MQHNGNRLSSEDIPAILREHLSHTNPTTLITTVTSGSPASTAATPGSNAPPTATPGSNAPPTATPGSNAPPTATPGSNAPPTATPGSNAPPTATPGSNAPPTATPGSNAQNQEARQDADGYWTCKLPKSSAFVFDRHLWIRLRKTQEKTKFLAKSTYTPLEVPEIDESKTSDNIQILLQFARDRGVSDSIQDQISQQRLHLRISINPRLGLYMVCKSISGHFTFMSDFISPAQTSMSGVNRRVLNFDQLLRNNSTRRLMARYSALQQFVQYLENTYDSFNEDPHKKTCQRETRRLKAEGMKEALDSHGAGEAEVAIGNTTYAAIEEAHCCGVKTIRRPNCYESSDFHQVKQNIAADIRTQGVMEKSQQELKRVRYCNKKSHSLVQIVAS